MPHTRLRMLCAAGALALPLLLTATTAQAGARRPGMAGSLLIEDQDDVWLFPQLTLDYRNLIALAYGPGGGGSGNALMTLGNDSFAFGVALHRGDVLTPHVVDEIGALNGPASLFGGAFTVGPATVFDLLLGFDVGGGDLGLRLGFGSGAQYTTAAGMDSGESDTFLMGEIGYGAGTRGESTRFDLSGAVLFDMAGTQVADNDTTSGTALGVSGLVRVFIPLDDTLDLGVLGNVRVSNTSVTDELAPGSPSNSEMNIGVGGGIGPALRLGRASVAGYGILNVDLGSQDPDTEIDNNETSDNTIVVPGVHMAVEVPLNDWFVVRSGAEYSFMLSGTSDDNDNGSSERTGAFGWNAGVGVIIDDFRFDGSLQHGFVTGGPNFIGGVDNQGFLAIASLSYNFDKARSGQAEPAPEPPPPPPVAEPEPEPPPPPPAPAPPPPAPAPAPTGWGITTQGSATTGPAPAPAPPPAPSR